MDAQYTMTPEPRSKSKFTVCRSDGIQIYRMRMESLRVRFYDPELNSCRFELRPAVWYSRTSDIVEQPVDHRFATLKPASLVGDSWDLLDAAGLVLGNLRSVRLKDSAYLDKLVSMTRRAKGAHWPERTQQLLAELNSLTGSIPFRALYVGDVPVAQFLRASQISPLIIDVLDPKLGPISEQMILATAVKALASYRTGRTLTARDRADFRQAVRAAAATG